MEIIAIVAMLVWLVFIGAVERGKDPKYANVPMECRDEYFASLER